MKRVAIVAIFLISGAVAAEEPPTLYGSVRTSIAHLGRAGFDGEQAAIQWLGTAFVIDDRCTLATAKHVIEGIPETQLIVRFQSADGASARTHRARLEASSSTRDLALLRFGPSQGAKKFCRDWQPLPIASAKPGVERTGQPIQIFGFPALEGAPPRDLPIVRSGLVASAELEWRGEPMLLLDLTGVPGFSGSPVLLEATGEVIGVVYGPGRTQRMYDFEWATPLTPDEVTTLLEQP